MTSTSRSPHNLFEVFLRLRPPPAGVQAAERILNVEEGPDTEGSSGNSLVPSHITLNPPVDRRRAIEKFSFTRVFEENASQLDVFYCTDIESLIEGVISPQGGEGTDAVVATLGVTGSGKTHTILGSKSQRGLTQLALDVLFRSLGTNIVEPYELHSAIHSLQDSDPSESQVLSACNYLDGVYGDALPRAQSRADSRAPTPATNESVISYPPQRNLARPSTLPQAPDVSCVNVSCDPAAEYVVVVSMYEVHNDRIYDLLAPPSKSASTKESRRRPLLFKYTELSPDRKVVAGLRKVACASFREAVMVLEAGLQERRVAGTGSNSTSSRSHGFFCFEVRKRINRFDEPWGGSRLTIVDLAGSERAREAKTAGATLVEAGKINESLMYLGQCLQTQSEAINSSKPNIVPYRQCKLTELLFSNSFPSASPSSSLPQASKRNPQRGIMIVTADPRGDFNATSQILRYSALAREVTVPRVPSITATILANPSSVRSSSPTQVHHNQRPTTAASSNGGPHRFVSADERAAMELAALEIANLGAEMDRLRDELDREQNARVTAEAHLLSMEDKMLDMEADIREDCAQEFEERLALELARFKVNLAIEQERYDEHWDRKVDVLERGLEHDDLSGDANKENILLENLEEEVERLRRDNIILKRELAGKSPTKRRPLEERDDFYISTSQQSQQSTPGTSPTRLSKTAISSASTKGDEVINLGQQLERLRVRNPGSISAPNSRSASGAKNLKKMRKLGKKWEDEADLDYYS